MLEAIIFDFDGLIMDTEMPVLQSWQEIYAEYGQELPVLDWIKCIGSGYGPDTFDPVADLEQRVGAALDWETLRARRHEREMIIVEGAALLPGVVALLDDAKAHGLRLAIGSSSPHRSIRLRQHRKASRASSLTAGSALGAVAMAASVLNAPTRHSSSM